MTNNLNLELAAFFVSLFCILYNYIRQYSRTTRSHFYKAMLISEIACVVVSILYDVFMAVVEDPAAKYFWCMLVLELYFILHSVLPAAFFMYAMALCGRLIGKSKSLYVFMTVPFLVAQALILTNPFTRLVFKMDAMGYYSRATFLYVIYVISILYIASAIVVIIENRHAITARFYYSILLFNLIAMAGVILQLVFPTVRVELFAEAVALLGLMLTCENEDLQIDSETLLKNREAFYADNQLALSSSANYSIIALSMPDLERDEVSVNRESTILLISEIANWLRLNSEGEAVYRLRISDFAIVLTRNPERASKLAKKIGERFSKPWHIKDMSIMVRIVISTAVIPETAVDLNEISSLFLFNRKDFAKSNVLIRNDDALNFVKRRSALEAAIKNALDNNTLMVYYQPIISTKTEKCVAAEALIRLKDPTLGMVSPEEFIPIAEQEGLIGQIGQYVFNSVCRFYHTYKLERLGLKWIEINISSYQLPNNQLFDGFNSSLAQYDVPVSFINLELTESGDVDSPALYMDTMRRLYEMGFSFSLDDYGTGYSNISRLLTGYYENVKLDKSILWNSNTLAGMKILKELKTLLNDMKLSIVQEGVETKEQLDLVKELGIPLVQGFYYSQPIPEKEFIKYVKEFNGV